MSDESRDPALEQLMRTVTVGFRLATEKMADTDKKVGALKEEVTELRAGLAQQGTQIENLKAELVQTRTQHASQVRSLFRAQDVPGKAAIAYDRYAVQKVGSVREVANELGVSRGYAGQLISLQRKRLNRG
jgi:predicted RNase H-like nuclease (RuvC/YqgF family)